MVAVNSNDEHRFAFCTITKLNEQYVNQMMTLHSEDRTEKKIVCIVDLFMNWLQTMNPYTISINLNMRNEMERERAL